LRAGKLIHLMSIQAVTELRDSYGGTKKNSTWATIDTDWSSLDSLTGREFFASQEIQAAATHTIKRRFISGVTPKHRILFGSRIFDILYANIDQEDKGMLTMIVKELV